MRVSRRARLAATTGLAMAMAGLPATRAGATPPIWEPSFGPALTISNADDQTTSNVTPVTFGTFSFPFYGTTYTGGTQLAVDTNGNLSLGTQVNSDNIPSGADLVTSNPPRIAPFWTDLIANDAPADQGNVYLNTFNDDGDPAIDRVVVTWAENDFGSCSGNTIAYPACGSRAQVQLKEDGTVIFGYDLAYPEPDGIGQPLMVGIAKGNAAANTDPGSLDWTQRAPGSSIGDAGYEIYASNPRIFDLVGRNLVFTPSGGGYTASLNGPDLAVGLSAPGGGLTGQGLTAVATVNNHGTTGSSGNNTHLSFPGATVTAATPSQGSCTVSGSDATCGLGALANGATATISVALTPNRVGPLHATAVLAPAELGDPAGDNQAASDTNVADSGGPQPGAGSGPAITIRAKGGQRLSKLTKGLKVLVGCSTACDVQALAGLKGKQPAGARDASLPAAGSTTVTIKLPSALLKKLRHAKSASFTVTVNASSVDGESVKSSTLKVKR